MESGAKGCEVVVSGKLRGQRAKSMKFVDGLMIHSGEPTNDYVDTATRHVLLRQGMYVITAQYMLLIYKTHSWGLAYGNGILMHDTTNST
jgi:small subunit ribosomal protein S3e